METRREEVRITMLVLKIAAATLGFCSFVVLGFLLADAIHSVVRELVRFALWLF